MMWNGFSRMGVLVALAAAISGEMCSAESRYLSIGPGGQRMWSEDGLTWSNGVSWGPPKHDQNDLHCATTYRGAFYVGGGFSKSRLTATRDGQKWSVGEIPRGGGPTVGLNVFNDRLYATTMRGVVFFSDDGSTFTFAGRAESPKIDYRVRGTAQGNGVIIGAGDFGTLIVVKGAAAPGDQKEVSFQTMAGQSEKKATLRRVAFGNGVFVIGGQDGLLATTADGASFENNETNPDRGDIMSVVWTGKEFLAVTATVILSSKDGREWSPQPNRQRLKFVSAANGLLFGRDWRRERIHASRDGGQTWTLAENPDGFHSVSVTYGELAGSGEPPALP